VESVDKKNAFRVGAVAEAVTRLTLLSSPAMALTSTGQFEPGDQLSAGEIIGLYVAIPIVSFFVIAGLVMVLSPKPKPKQK
jgi:hypothetical protein